MFKKQIFKFLLFTLCVAYVQIGFAQKVTVINQKGTKFDVVNNIVTTSATSPTDPQIGDVWFDTTTNLSKIHNGSNWDELGGINTNFEVVGTNLEITDSNGTLSIPLEDISTDDQNIDYVAFDPATNILTVAIENGDPKTVNLTALYADGSETKITGAGINVVSGLGTTANPYIITGTELDGNITNEVNTAFGSSANTLTITDSNSALTAPIVNSNALSIASGELTSTVNGVASTPIALPVADGTETVVTAGTNISITGDGSAGTPYVVNNTFTELDGSTTNEIQTITAGTGITVTPTGNDYSITNSAPDQTVSITGTGASTVTGTYPNFTVTSTDNVDDADADPNNEKSDLSLSGNILTLSNPTTATNQVDLSTVNTDSQNLSSAVVTANETVEVQISNGTNTTINIQDADADPNNELQTLTQSTGTSATGDVTLSNGGGTVKVVSADTGNQITAGTDGGAYLSASTSDLAVYTGFFIINSNSNNFRVTGLPFQPSQITFVAHANIESLNIDNDNGIGVANGTPDSGNNNNTYQNAFGTMNGFARFNSSDSSITQQVIYIGGNANSINDISRYASSDYCIGIRYSNQNGDQQGYVKASLKSFDTDGFTLDVDERRENIVVLYTAYK